MELYYQIALKSVPFDNSYKNVLRFDTRSEQEAYFETNTLFSNRPNVNFNVGSLYATNVIYDGTEENINELLNNNYCIIKDNRPNAQLKFYYYFVTNAMQDCDNRIKLSLELDIFQTYYIDLNFGDSIIYKAHLDRFVPNEDGTVSFDGSPTSKLFEREELRNVAKRMTKRTNVSLYPNTEIGNWLKQNVLGWLYIYADPLVDFNFIGMQNTFESVQGGRTTIVNKSIDGGKIPSNITVFAYPIYKSNKRIIFTNEDMVGQGISGRESSNGAVWGEWETQISTVASALKYFANLNDGYSKVYSVKFSPMSPIVNYDIQFSIDNDNLNVPITLSNGRIVNPFTDNTGGTSTGILTFSVHYDLNSKRHSTIACIGYQEANIESELYSINKEIKFEKSSIIGSNKNIKFNPKLLSSDYFNLRISDQTENGFDYDLQKMNINEFKILYSEALVPDMAKKYIRISNLNGVYIKETEENLTGFISTNDTSLLLPTSKFQDMLANNKNFFLQKETDVKFMGARHMINLGENVINQNYQKAVFEAGRNALDTAQYVINTNFAVDNLQNAPSNIQGAKGNAIFENMYSKNGIIVEEWDILENEKEMINDFMCLFGFTYNRVDNVKNVDNIRKFYNFVRADIETINGTNISERVHEKFRECFAKGVRFWNTDTFSYDKENYERWLENE